MDKYYKVINVQQTNGKDALKISDYGQAIATAIVLHNTIEGNPDFRVIEYCRDKIRVIGDNGKIN